MARPTGWPLLRTKVLTRPTVSGRPAAPNAFLTPSCQRPGQINTTVCALAVGLGIPHRENGARLDGPKASKARRNPLDASLATRNPCRLDVHHFIETRPRPAR